MMKQRAVWTLLAAFALVQASLAVAVAAPAVPVPDVIAPVAAPLIQPISPGSQTSLPATEAGFRPAPMPDADVASPGIVADDTTRVTPAVYAAKRQFRGDGFGADALQSRTITPATGLALNVPLD